MGADKINVCCKTQHKYMLLEAHSCVDSDSKIPLMSNTKTLGNTQLLVIQRQVVSTQRSLSVANCTSKTHSQTPQQHTATIEVFITTWFRPQAYPVHVCIRNCNNYAYVRTHAHTV